ncbi:MAG: cell division protein FtsA [Candidatus Paceibacterota bacterium]
MYITALDIGSAQIKTLIAEARKDGKLALAGVFKTPSEGIRKGEIISTEDATRSINSALAELKRFNKAALKNIFINVGGSNVKIHNSRGIIAVSRADSEISQDDIDRVMKASQAINLSPNRMILHTLAREFVIDNISDIREPLGMIGTRLEVNTLIIDAFTPVIKNLIKCIETTGGSLGGLIYGPLAAARSILTKNQKDLGVVLIDIGFGTTGMAVYEEGKLLNASVFPVGTSNITNDLAIGLKCSIKTAETVKLSFGCALAKDVPSKERVDLSQIDENIKAAPSQKFISEIIEVRLAEIFEFINDELKLIGKMGQLPAGAVLCGSGAKMPGIVELVKQELKLPAQIGIPETNILELTNAEFGTQIEDPEFATAVGLLFWGSDQLIKDSDWFPIKKFSFKNLWRYFKP